MSLEKHYSVPFAAKQLGIPEDSIRAAIHSGELVAFNGARNPDGERPRWRISESELGKFLLRRRNAASLSNGESEYRPIRRKSRSN